MPGIDAQSFDGTIVQTELEADCGFTPEVTQLGLVAQATDGFVVVHGSDANRDTFSDADLSAPPLRQILSSPVHSRPQSQ